MANVITIIKKIISPQNRRCPACKRTLQQSIGEQVIYQIGCPLEHCAFKTEIQQAILKSKTPEIILWNVNKREVFENEDITIYWEVLYAKRIIISVLGEVPLKGFRQICIERDTNINFELDTNNGEKYEGTPISIKVYPIPYITSFTCTKEKILAGEKVDLTWKVENYTKIRLIGDGPATDVTNISSYKIQPNSTTTYKLIVTSLGDLKEIESEITVQVLHRVEIVFSADKTHTIQTLPITLSWNVKHATSIFLQSKSNELGAEYGSLFDVSKESAISVTPETTTVYKITAKNELDDASREILISVIGLPTITGLSLPAIPQLPEIPQLPDLSALNLSLSNLNLKNSLYFPRLLQNEEIGRSKQIQLAEQFKNIYNIIILTFNNINKEIFKRKKHEKQRS
jgi:hypothetical protein